MDNIIKDYWEFFIPAVLFIYSVIITIVGQDEVITNIKRFYYTVIIFIYIIFINIFDVKTWFISSGPIGINSVVWSYFISMLITFIIAIFIDNFIISGYIFKEFGFFGAKFIRDVTKKTVDVQYQYLLNLERSLETLSDVPQAINKLFQDETIINEVKTGTFNELEGFASVLKYYYKHKNVSVDILISMYFINHREISDLIDECADQYQLKELEKLELRIRLRNSKGVKWYINRKNYNIYVLTIKQEDEDKKMLLIMLKSFNETNLHDAYPIYNFIYFFRLEMDRIKELPISEKNVDKE